MAETFELSQGWRWKQRDHARELLAERPDGSNWHDVSAMPSEIHVELVRAGRIPHPYLGHNEHKVQWVGEREWLYASTFDAHVNDGKKFAELVFEGLDTYCDVYLNGVEILKADNMFRPYTVKLDVSKLKRENDLLLHFKSTKLIAKEYEQQYGRVRAGSCNLGDPCRVYVRKAQYHFRWDWGPELMCAGPWRPVFLRTYNAALEWVYPKARVSADLQSGLAVDFRINGNAELVTSVRVSLLDGKGTVVREGTVSLQSNRGQAEHKNVVDWNLGGQTVELWWPVGYGQQYLYTVETTLISEDETVLDVTTQRIGFRRVELIQEPLVDQPGTTFLFEINNVRIFMGGSNWVPADNLLTTINTERYRSWLELLRDGRQNMVRMWGGGVYEPSEFYDICDELGILVWQDFQFACGVYPAHEYFVKQVKEEAECAVRRLRRHPSMVIFCGNNEDYQQVLQWGDVKDLPAKLLYEHVLPEVVQRLTEPEIPYHRGSPYGGKGWDTSDPTVGDIHQWTVWGGAGLCEPHQNYDILGGRFVSEFGLPAMPDIRTIDYWMDGDTTGRYSNSKMMAQHCKAGGHERRFANYMNENFRLARDFESYVYLTQVLQSEGIGGAYRVWRREWRGPGQQYNAGVLVWQINDSWPVTSWALADYFLRPKPVYWKVARELLPFTVGILRTVHQNRWNDRPRQFYEFGAFQSRDATIEVWATNSTLEPQDAILDVTCVDLESDWKYRETHDVVLLSNQSIEVVKKACPHPPVPASQEKDSDPLIARSASIIVHTRLLDRATGKVLSRCTDWPQPYRYLDFPDPGLSLKIEQERISISVQNPVKALVFSVQGDGPEVKWSDNTLDIMPGDPQEIAAQGLNGRKLKAAYMGREHAQLI